MWGHENSQRLVYYDRILQPAPFLVTFYKNVAKLNFKKVTSLKTYINSLINKSTNMYLKKGDEVEIIEEKENWLHIRYYGKKVVEGWIKKSDVE
jgi:SH3-like domain-containing protein